jgi:CheY-like chemotaxis protein
LLADDEAAIRLTLGVLLQRCGYAVTTAASGVEALQCIQQHSFDLLLLDLLLPGLNGLDVAERARAWQPDIPVVFLTGSGALGQGDMRGYASVCKTASPQETLPRVLHADKVGSVAVKV